jgi:hypothetical protein
MHLFWGATVAQELRMLVYEKLGFTSSCGISHSKTMAKLASKLNRPRNQTTVCFASARAMLSQIPLYQLPSVWLKLGRKRQETLKLFKTTHNAESTLSFLDVPKVDLIRAFGASGGEWIYSVARFQDTNVTPSAAPKQILVSMSLTPFSDDTTKARRLFLSLAKEMAERLKDEELRLRRRPRVLVFQYRQENKKEVHLAIPASTVAVAARDGQSMRDFCPDAILAAMLSRFQASLDQHCWTLRWIGLAAQKFEAVSASDISRFFSASPTPLLISEPDKVEFPPVSPSVSFSTHSHRSMSSMEHIQLSSLTTNSKLAVPSTTNSTTAVFSSTFSDPIVSSSSVDILSDFVSLSSQPISASSPIAASTSIFTLHDKNRVPPRNLPYTQVNCSKTNLQTQRILDLFGLSSSQSESLDIMSMDSLFESVPPESATSTNSELKSSSSDLGRSKPHSLYTIGTSRTSTTKLLPSSGNRHSPSKLKRRRFDIDGKNAITNFFKISRTTSE